MSRKADVVIIGAGVIGAATAYELARKGYKTLNIDKLPAAGYGPDERVVRHRARALLLVGRRRDGVRGLLLLEGLGGLPRRRGRVRPGEVHELRHAAAREPDRPPREGPQALSRRRRRVRGVVAGAAQGAHADLRHARVLSAQAARRPALLGPVRGRAHGRDLHAGLGLRQRPAARVAQPPARRRGAWRRVPLPRDGHRDPPGQRPRRGRHPRRRARDRRAGRHQRRRPALRHRQRDGRRDGRHERPHEAAAPRGPPRPRAAGLRLRRERHPLLGRRHRHLLPARESATTSSSAPRTRTATSASGSPTPTTTTGTSRRRSGRRRSTASPAGSRRSGSRTTERASSTSTTARTTGSRSTTARASAATTWRSGRAATSSRTPRSSAT